MNRREMLAASAGTAAAVSLGASVAKAAAEDSTILPPGVSRETFNAAIARFRAAVGERWVFTKQADLARERGVTVH